MKEKEMRQKRQDAKNAKEGAGRKSHLFAFSWRSWRLGDLGACIEREGRGP
jgi:hypothetical protein